MCLHRHLQQCLLCFGCNMRCIHMNQPAMHSCLLCHERELEPALEAMALEWVLELELMLEHRHLFGLALDQGRHCSRFVVYLNMSGSSLEDTDCTSRLMRWCCSW